MSDFNKIGWSNDEYSLEKFLNLFPLPQVVRIKRKSKGRTLGIEQPQDNSSDDVYILHSVRNKEVIRATDNLKNAFLLPHDSTAKVEVIWKNYKKFYDNVEDLSNDFPAHVLVVDEDMCLGIKKGDVLKLNRKIKLRENKYLKCAFLDKKRGDVSIPFSYKGLFKTLGDLEEEKVYLSNAVEFCKLPRLVKFIDNKLKMKRIDETSKYPTALCSLENVTLHEIMDYIDVVATKSTSEGQVTATSFPLNVDIKVIAPSADSLSDPNYTRLCEVVDEDTKAEMAKSIGILHGHWVVFQEDDTAQKTFSWSHELFTLDHQGFEDVQNVIKVNVSLGHDRGSSIDENAPSLPPKEKQTAVPPPIPPKELLKPYMRKDYRIPSSPSRLNTDKQGSLMVSIDNNNKSKSLPRVFSPSQPKVSEDSKMYETIWFHGAAGQKDKHQVQGNEVDKCQDVRQLINVRFGGSAGLDSVDGYVPMASNVPHLTQTKNKSLYETMEIQTHPDKDLRGEKPAVKPQTFFAGNHPFTGQEKADAVQYSDGERLRPEKCSPEKEKIIHREQQQRRSYEPKEQNSRASTIPRRRVNSEAIENRPPCPAPSTVNPSVPFNNSEEEIYLKIKFQPSLHITGLKGEVCSQVQGLNANADRHNDLKLMHSTKKKTKAPKGLEFINDKDLRMWSHVEVSKFLKFLNFDKYAKIFKERKIDGKALANLDDKGLKDLNVTNSSHAATIMKFVHECIKYEHSTVPNEYQPS